MCAIVVQKSLRRLYAEICHLYGQSLHQFCLVNGCLWNVVIYVVLLATGDHPEPPRYDPGWIRTRPRLPHGPHCVQVQGAEGEDRSP